MEWGVRWEKGAGGGRGGGFYYICNESSVLQPKTRANFTTSMSRYVTMEPTGSL